MLPSTVSPGLSTWSTSRASRATQRRHRQASRSSRRRLRLRRPRWRGVAHTSCHRRDAVGRTAAPSVLPHNRTGQQKSRDGITIITIRKANVLANWTSSTAPTFTPTPPTDHLWTGILTHLSPSSSTPPAVSVSTTYPRPLHFHTTRSQRPPHATPLNQAQTTQTRAC